MPQALKGNPRLSHDGILKPDDSLLALANLEVEGLRDLLAKRLSVDIPVTFLLYQPVITEEEELPKGCKGRMVDVGPFPTGALVNPVYQALSGASGSYLLDDNTAGRFMPLPTHIDEAIIESYIGAGPRQWRLLQVAVEKLRYQHFVSEWHSDEAPPIGKWMYQVPFAPFPSNVDSIIRHPNLGSVYTLNEIPDAFARVANNPEDKNAVARATVWKLNPHAATSGSIALQHRFTTLLGADRVSRIVRLAAKRSVSGDGDDCQLVGSILLAHHWFFGYDPVAYRLICHLIRERLSLFENQVTDVRLRQCINEIYTCHSLCPHGHDGEQRDGTILFTLLKEDCFSMLAYSAQIFNPSAHTPLTRETILSPICTMLMLICGGLYSLSGGIGCQRLYPVRTKDEWNRAKLICVAHPDSLLSGADLHIPVFERGALSDNLCRGDSEEKPLSFLGAGESEKSYGRGKVIQPVLRLERITMDERSLRAVLTQRWPEKELEKPWDMWLRDFVRCRIVQELARLDTNVNPLVEKGQ